MHPELRRIPHAHWATMPRRSDAVVLDLITNTSRTLASVHAEAFAANAAREESAVPDLPALIAEHLDHPDLAVKVQRLNELRRLISSLSPFAGEPVDLVEWVPTDAVQANDYNPNSVAPPEMELLRLSIMADGYTQPVVTNEEEGTRVVIDGFHRNRVARECDDVRDRLHGYLPVVQIRGDRVDRPDRMASTIRHNRARGKHQVLAMSDIVLELKRRNWSDDKVAKELGMDPDEVLRLAQITGMAEAFKDRDFSQAWEAVLDIEDDGTDFESINV